MDSTAGSSIFSRLLGFVPGTELKQLKMRVKTVSVAIVFFAEVVSIQFTWACCSFFTVANLACSLSRTSNGCLCFEFFSIFQTRCS